MSSGVISLITYSLAIKTLILSAYLPYKSTLVHIWQGCSYHFLSMGSNGDKVKCPSWLERFVSFCFPLVRGNACIWVQIDLFFPLQLQSGRFIYYSWHYFWHQLSYFTCSSRILILSGTFPIHLQDQRLELSIQIQHLMTGAALDL